jgi:hypothetical protein
MVPVRVDLNICLTWLISMVALSFRPCACSIPCEHLMQQAYQKCRSNAFTYV